MRKISSNQRRESRWLRKKCVTMFCEGRVGEPRLGSSESNLLDPCCLSFSWKVPSLPDHGKLCLFLQEGVTERTVQFFSISVIFVVGDDGVHSVTHPLKHSLPPRGQIQLEFHPKKIKSIVSVGRCILFPVRKR